MPGKEQVYSLPQDRPALLTLPDHASAGNSVPARDLVLQRRSVAHDRMLLGLQFYVN